ncbi:MAG: lysophospholipid acyltransferase family protein [Bryobacteraceae bacterium]|nr:lysophospholipid acyltransferase family protein [Bryobacteraceae bacterium]
MRQRSFLRNALEYGAVRLLLGTLAAGPKSLSLRLADFYTDLLDLAVPRLRRTALRNLELAMPELSHQERTRIVEGVFASIARMMVVFARFPQIHRGNIGEWIRYEGYEHVENARKRGKGVLFATAHLGNWELSAFAHAILSGPMHVVVRPLDNPYLDRLVSRYRSLSGNRLAEKKDFLRGILRALHDNEAVGILVDQNAGLNDGVFVDFFGLKASANPGFAKLAAKSGATVVPGFALWSETEGRYVLRFDPPIEITGDPVVDTQRIQAHIESVIRRYPDQWLWIHRRWKTRPPGEKPLYDR